MTIDKKLINQIIKVSSKAAYASSLLVGKNDKIAADKAAVDAMRTELNSLDINGKVVIGEGELDEAPMLYIGESLGSKNGPNIDIAVDPVEGTNFAAKNLPGALSVISIAEKGNLFHAPETYMNKIAAKVNDKNIVDLDFDIKTNLNNLSQYKNKNLEDLIVCILDRPRHKKIIDEIHNLGAKTKLITDGDVAGALLVTDTKFKVDLFLGIGGGPEGVLAASALDAYGCYFQGRLIFENDNDKKRAADMGIKDHDKKYSLNEIVSGDSIFCATGITSGDLVKGISIKDKKFESQTLVTHKSSNTKEIISKVFDIE
jgi:fructose-1,6-bisphosphatase II / sedoheptulose-1,7-bisphosphatase